ncbi:thioredoxin family protein [Arenibacter sp. F20364]|uniref:thioredoxin family protein n=1 Tax=Arenibacter sp. F20364 TaxID=2926415 RepID=UPI001FF3D901|nr:thioredoxin family protein [Arenibacter sp. F20364]MCK0188423.1 thioredoxin family protein [Arenibacter sp. F20364]
MKRLILFSLTLALFSFVKPESLTQLKDESKVHLKLQGVGIGDSAPYFNLKNIDGKQYSFDNIIDGNGKKPKGFVVVFTCNTCPYAKANEQRLIDLHKTFAPKGYPIVAIQPNDPSLSPGDSFDAMKANAKKKGFPFLYLIDDGQKIFPKYGATKTPEVFLIDSKRIVRYHGAIDDSPRDGESVTEKYVEMAIEAIEAGKDPNTKTTKAVGCGIKST